MEQFVPRSDVAPDNRGRWPPIGSISPLLSIQGSRETRPPATQALTGHLPDSVGLSGPTLGRVWECRSGEQRETEAGGRGWSSAPAPQHGEPCGAGPGAELARGPGGLGACGHAGKPRPPLPCGQPGGLLLRSSCQSQGATDKTDKHLPVAGRWWEETQSRGCPHCGWKH